MELRHLLYFKTVSEQLHFRRAAELLFISQPPLSRQIKELEEELGAQLFIRNNKRVSLTDAGKYFKNEVDSIFARLEESKNTVKKIHELESGELKIGYISSVYQPHLAAVLKEMRVEFPFVKTSLYELPTVKQIEAIEQGKLDAGILRAPVDSEKIQLKSLYFDPFMVVLPQTDLSAPVTEEVLGALIKDMPFIFFNQEYAPDYHQKLVEICGRMGFRPNIVHEANNVHSIIQLVEAGLGVSILPLSLKNQYMHLNISFYDLTTIPIVTEVVLAYKKNVVNQALNWFIARYSE